MTGDLLLLAVFVLAALDPPRVWPVLPDRPSGARRAAAAAGVVVAFAVLAVLAAAADPLLDALDIEPETWRIGAGGVLLLAALRNLLLDRADPEPALPGWRAGLVPFAFPLLLGPEVAVLAIRAGADHGSGTAVGAAALALAVVLAGGLLPPPTGVGRTVVTGAGRVLGGLLAVLSVDLLVDGIRAV